MAEMMERRKLIEYLPDFMQKFSEIKELMQAANVETDRIYPLIGKSLDEAFIEDCSEYGIRKYESCLHIIPDESETLETRKLRVLMRWYDYAPYTFRVLINKLNMICGVNNYDLQADLENYYFKVITELGVYGSVEELAYMYESILPENIFYESVNTLNIESKCSLGYVGGICFSSMMTFTEDWKDSQAISSAISIGGGTVFSENLTLTEDYTDKGVIEGDAHVTGTAVFSNRELITNDFKESATVSGQTGIAAGTVQAQFFEIKN